MTQYDQWYKKEIVKNMIQAARIDLFGVFVENGRVIRLSPSSYDEYKDHFLKQAFFEAKNFLISQTNDIDLEVDDES